MVKELHKIKSKEKNKVFVNIINSGLKDLKEEIKIMPEEERKIEKPDKIVKLVEEILKFNKQKQEGQGIKIITPSQMLSRLPISLAQLEAGNNSGKLKNEIRQLLYSLYRSRYITKQVYNNLIKPTWINNAIIFHKSFIVIMVTTLLILLLLFLLLLILKVYIIKNGDNSYECRE